MIQIDSNSNQLVYPKVDETPVVVWPIRQVDEITEKSVIRSTKVSQLLGNNL